jgi:hypothetical protein
LVRAAIFVTSPRAVVDDFGETGDGGTGMLLLASPAAAVVATANIVRRTPNNLIVFSVQWSVDRLSADQKPNTLTRLFRSFAELCASRDPD